MPVDWRRDFTIFGTRLLGSSMLCRCAFRATDWYENFCMGIYLVYPLLPALTVLYFSPNM
jgi:hypothetical protein